MDAKDRSRFESLLILGGGGLVGTQVAKRAVRDLRPERIIICGLFRGEVQSAIEGLSAEFPGTTFQGYYGNIFLRGRPIPVHEDVSLPTPAEQKSDRAVRNEMFSDIYREFEPAYEQSLMAQLIRTTRPTAIVDCVNTATGISYQNVFLASDVVERGLDEIRAHAEETGDGDEVRISKERLKSFGEDVDDLLVSIALPELILHIRLLYRAMVEAGTRIYLKVGTTGTGGMGLNIPYTHGEDRPSPTLMSKTAIAFAQTGLLFLMARTADGPIVKEVKPAAMIGYRQIDFSLVRGPQYVERDGKITLESGQAMVLHETKEQALGSVLDMTPQLRDFAPLKDTNGEPLKMQLPAVNTGENGMFTRGEFEAITYSRQMEFITPEEIAEDIILELLGANTGHDVISAIDSSVMNPTYKAGMIRHVAIEELEKLEKETGVPSVAIGQLGPPQLAKYLYEAQLFHVTIGTLDQILAYENRAEAGAEEISQLFFEFLKNDSLLHTITTIGIPILHPDGRKIWRGPVIKIPPYNPKKSEMVLSEKTIDTYAKKGWVDLRPAHMRWWLDMFRRMRNSTHAPDAKWSSERLTRAAYLPDDVRIGQVVAWIFNNAIEPPGHRIK